MFVGNVQSMYFTMTAWTHNLKYIKQPYVRFTDDELDMELCRYNLEDQDTGTNTAVIMCKLSRDSPNEVWSVLAIWYHLEMLQHVIMLQFKILNKNGKNSVKCT